MGEEISEIQFTEEDFSEYRRRVGQETRLLNEWFKDKAFSKAPPSYGIELEGWLVDRDYLPKPCNDDFLKCTQHPQITHELSKYNFEINSSVHGETPQLLSQMQGEIEKLWKHSLTCAQKVGAKPLMVGILPTLSQEDLHLENMSGLNRYTALAQQFMELRRGVPLSINIEGKDQMKIYHENIMLEAATTSAQIHIQVTQEDAVRHYNAAQIISGPLVALGANSPFLFGRELWEETRIPLFEQAVSAAGFQGRRGVKIPMSVSFGSGYASETLFEPFMENFISFPMLLPLLYDEPAEKLRHLSLLNGTIWRWNRPIVGFDLNAAKTPHLRIEQRVLSSGPSPVDIVANVAFYLGMMRSLVKMKEAPELQLPFDNAKTNFYRCAQWGLSAWMLWTDGKEILVKDLILERCLPLAMKGLKDMGVSQAEADFYLKGVIRSRVKSGLNGAAWQCRAADALKGDLKAMTEKYWENQSSGKPVHEWKIA